MSLCTCELHLDLQGLIFQLFLGLFYSIQDNLLFYPDIGPHRACVPSPQIYGLPFEVVYIKTRDKVSLHSYFIRHPEQKGSCVPTFVYFHGNAGNIGGRLQNCNGIYHNLQCNILLVGEFRKFTFINNESLFDLFLEYRGYGLSNGSPSEKGLYIDARAAVDYLFTRHDLDHSQIVLFGRSLGGAVVSFSSVISLMCFLSIPTLPNAGDRRSSRLKLRKQSDVFGGREFVHINSADGTTSHQLCQIYSAYLP